MTAALQPQVIDRAFRAMGCDLRIAVVPRQGEEAAASVERAIAFVHAADRALTRFDAASELQRLNASGSERIAISGLMALAVEHAVRAAQRTDGLLDPTLAAEVVEAGYADDWDPARRVALRELLAAAPTRHAARPHPAARWREITVDRHRHELVRPAGIQLDLAATAKGLVADLALRLIGPADLVIVDLAGDLAIGGDRLQHAPQPIIAADPFDRTSLHLLLTAPGGVATSSIAGRCWLDRGRPAHHLLDPATGRPAFTGLVQVTAAAPSAAEAEVLAGHALLAGPSAAHTLLARHGGVLVHDDGTTSVLVGDHLHQGDPDDRS